MKKIIAISIIIALLISFALLAIPKKELPTDAEWNAWLEYLEYEEQFYRDRDAGLFN